MVNQNYDRLYVALLLPYQVGSLEIDERALRNLLRYFLQPTFVNAGGGIVVSPVAGEIHFLSREEKRRVVRIAVEECGGKIPVFAGAIDWTTSDTVEVARDAKAAGADGIFIIPPAGPSDISLGWDCVRHPEIWMDMVKEIDQEVHLPMIGHPTAPAGASFTGGLALEPTLKMCRTFPNIVGWKMTYSYQNYVTIAQGLRSLDHHVGILAASGGNFQDYLENQLFDGTVSGCWNYAMEPMVDHIQAWKSGNVEKARSTRSSLQKLHGYVKEDKTHHHLKYKTATWLRGLIPSPFMRPPMPWPERQVTPALRDLLKNAGLSVISDEEIEAGLNNRPELLRKSRSAVLTA